MKWLKDAGDEVIGAGAADGFENRLGDIGIKFVPLPLPFKSISPLGDLGLLLYFYKLYRSERPDVVHHFTIKPVIYGSIAARLARVPRIVNTITGLGFVFSGGAGRLLRKIVEMEYRTAISCAHFTLFENNDDRSMFIQLKLATDGNTGLQPGAGVNTERFAPCSCSASGGGEHHVVFLMMARLLRDKGVYEYVDAARRVRKKCPSARFQLLGKRDEHNPTVVPLADLQSWQESGVIEYLGEMDDVRDAIACADVMVLPSYREGTPRSLLEGAAMGKPIITTDAVGCREVVDQGVNGIQVPVKDTSALAAAMICMLEDSELRAKMGRAGREKIVRQFDEKIVIQRCIEVYAQTVT